MIALISTLGYITLITLAMVLFGIESVITISAILGEPYGLIIGWYFSRVERKWKRRS
ncbi:MAG: hypothetical protein H3Z53_02455 [archaeon]|nr:hypothetical protein [archaeon]MCP8313221.1 hypothetical protein [archaeon]MCP8320827.1 hypothetical protein [archaeon]